MEGGAAARNQKYVKNILETVKQIWKHWNKAPDKKKTFKNTSPKNIRTTTTNYFYVLKNIYLKVLRQWCHDVTSHLEAEAFTKVMFGYLVQFHELNN